MGLWIEMEGGGPVPSVALRGELDVYTAPDFARWVDENLVREPAVVVDLEKVDLLDSCGLAALVRLSEGRDRRVVVVCGHGAIRRVVELTSLADRLELSHDRESAMLRLASPTAEATPAAHGSKTTGPAVS